MSSFLSFLSLRDEEISSSRFRTFIGGGLHAVLHGVPAVLSVLSLHLISKASEFSLGLVFLLSTVLSLMGFLRVLRANDGKLEGDITRALRNFLSAGLIAATFDICKPIAVRIAISKINVGIIKCHILTSTL